MVSPLARDLTDAAQNQAVLDGASALEAGETSLGSLTRDHGAAVAAEAEAAAAGRARLAAAAGGAPVHLSVVWAMYGETGRLATREAHPHGEDLLRVKVRQLDWLVAGTGVTWSAVAVDDGCPDAPTSAEMARRIATAEQLPQDGPRGVAVLDLADVLRDGPSVGPAFDALTDPTQSRKGGAILAGLAHALRTPVTGRHVVAYTDADLSADLAQLGALAAPILTGGAVAALGQRYGLPGAVLVKADGPLREPQSTGGKPDKHIVLLRHAVRATLIPQLAHVLDTQAGLKAFAAEALAPVLGQMTSFDETFDVELLVRLATAHGAEALAVEPIVFAEDFTATNFPSVEPGARHLAMLQQVVALHDRLVAPGQPATGEGAELLALVCALDVPAYVRLVEGLRARDDPQLFASRWPAAQLRALAAPA